MQGRFLGRGGSEPLAVRVSCWAGAGEAVLDDRGHGSYVKNGPFGPVGQFHHVWWRQNKTCF